MDPAGLRWPLKLESDVATGFDLLKLCTETNAFRCRLYVVIRCLKLSFTKGVRLFYGDVVTGFDPVAAGEYTLVYTETNAFGCEASCVRLATPLPVIDCPEYGPLCQGDPAIVFDETGVFNGDVVTAFDPVAAG